MKQKRRRTTTKSPKKTTKVTSPPANTSPPSPPIQTAKSPLSSISLAQMLSGFLTFRSTIKDLSTSLQRMESIMDNTYQFFNLAQNFMGRRTPGPQNRPFFPMRPNPPNNQRGSSSESDEEIPVIQWPKDGQNIGNPLLGRLLQNVDMNQLLSIMQSPFIQRIITRFMGAPKAQTSQLPTRGRRSG